MEDRELIHRTTQAQPEPNGGQVGCLIILPTVNEQFMICFAFLIFIRIFHI